MKNFIRKEINDSIVQNYWYCKYDSGIIHLLFNTVERWIPFHRYSNDEYGFMDAVDDEYTINIPELEELIPDNMLCTTCQEKDQVSFYWIPLNMIDKIVKL